jgi:Type III restriction enzyme, res subunit
MAMELFTQLFGDLLAFVYHCFDRIVIHGYLSGLSRPEQVVHFFRNVVGVATVDKDVLSQRTADYQAWVEAFAQQTAVAELIADLRSAKEEILRRERPQAIMLSAPTASGKTVMMTALIEKILGGDGGIPGDHEFDAEPDAVFLWLSDQPELNRQSRLRLLASSNRLRSHDLVVVASDLDAEFFDGGKVFFLNSQKLGRDKLLTSYGDGRHWTIWDTIRNTQLRQPDRFYVIIDEAHRGMNVSAQERAQANSIVQKFILGSPTDGLPPANLILGVSATPERFAKFLAGTNRPLRQQSVDHADVRSSGLIKDRIVLHPGEGQPSPWTLLAEACGRLVEMTDEWHRYGETNDLPRIDPAVIIQIEDGTENTLTRTPLGTLFEILRAHLPHPDRRPGRSLPSKRDADNGRRLAHPLGRSLFHQRGPCHPRCPLQNGSHHGLGLPAGRGDDFVPCRPRRHLHCPAGRPDGAHAFRGTHPRQ